jgi:predicted nucleotidyltransferase
MKGVTFVLTPDQGDHLARIAARHGLRLIVGFGSRVRGQPHPRSDLDLAVLPSAGADLQLEAFSAMLADLSTVFPGVELDLVFLPHADPLLLKKIFETGVLLHGDPVEFRRYRVYAFRRYSEYLPYLRLEEEATRRLIRQLRHAD